MAAPRGLAASTHILKGSHLRDVPEIEFPCMKAARRHAASRRRTKNLQMSQTHPSR